MSPFLLSDDLNQTGIAMYWCGTSSVRVTLFFSSLSSGDVLSVNDQLAVALLTGTNGWWDIVRRLSAPLLLT